MKKNEFLKQLSEASSRTKGFISFLVLVLALFLYSTFINKPDEAQIKPKIAQLSSAPQLRKTSVESPNKPLGRPTATRRSTSRSKVKLVDGQQMLFDSLEVSTRAYLESVIGPTMMEEWEFDPNNKIKLAIQEMFKLNEQALVNMYKNRVVNSLTLDTIRADTIDLRDVLYK